MVGEGAADKDGRGNVTVGDGGMAFLLASTGNLPGGTPLVRAPTWAGPGMGPLRRLANGCFAAAFDSTSKHFGVCAVICSES